MENKTSDKVVEFISNHLDNQPSKVALALSKRPELPKEFILSQINGRQKAFVKIPFLQKFPSYIFPNSRSVSQSSSEAAAKYKSQLISGKKIIDGSGGMGIDSYFFSKKIGELNYVEQNLELFEITKKNFKTLESNNIFCFNESIESHLKRLNEKVDCIYLDPDRRKESSRLFKIEDCEPNVLNLMDSLWNRADQIMIKFSPMLDIKKAIEQLKFVKEVHIVSVKNDCKELLFILEKNISDEPNITAVDIIEDQKNSFNFNFVEEQKHIIKLSDPLKYLYEPNVSILKAGGFKSIANHFNLKKIATNTHLYTSTEYCKPFPGRIIEILQVDKPKKGLINKANVICRNFSLKPEELKRKFKILDGGPIYLYACKNKDGKGLFITGEKV